MHVVWVVVMQLGDEVMFGWTEKKKGEVCISVFSFTIFDMYYG